MDEVFDLNQFIMSSFSYTSALVHCLQDSSESNKDIALGLLLSLPFSHQIIKVSFYIRFCASLCKIFGLSLLPPMLFSEIGF